MEVFKSQKKILRFCGIERFPSNRMKNVFKVFKIWNLFVFFYYAFSSGLFVVTTLDIRELSESLAPGTTAFIMFIKYAVFCSRAEDIFEIMDEIEELNEKCGKKFRFFNSKNYFFFYFKDKNLPNASEILSKANKLSLQITKPLKFGCIGSVVLYTSKPLLADFVNYYFYGLQSSRELPLKAGFLYDVKQSPAYELTFLFQSYATAFIAAYVVCILIKFGKKNQNF